MNTYRLLGKKLRELVLFKGSSMLLCRPWGHRQSSTSFTRGDKRKFNLILLMSLSQLVRWMGSKDEELGVEIYTGFAASE
ncbi:hypothetical protein MKX01_021916, partial [Papaver californicum]